MATIKERAIEYAEKLSNANHKDKAAQEVLSSLNSLIYSDTKEKLSVGDKKKILEYVREIFKKNDGSIIYKEADNRNYLLLVSYMISQIGNNKSEGK